MTTGGVAPSEPQKKRTATEEGSESMSREVRLLKDPYLSKKYTRRGKAVEATEQSLYPRDKVVKAGRAAKARACAEDMAGEKPEQIADAGGMLPFVLNGELTYAECVGEGSCAIEACLCATQDYGKPAMILPCLTPTLLVLQSTSRPRGSATTRRSTSTAAPPSS